MYLEIAAKYETVKTVVEKPVIVMTSDEFDMMTLGIVLRRLQEDETLWSKPHMIEDIKIVRQAATQVRVTVPPATWLDHDRNVPVGLKTAKESVERAHILLGLK